MVTGEGKASTYAAFLRTTGFIVSETGEWPEEGVDLRDYHAVIVRVRTMRQAAMIAARLRAKPHFGRRLLLGIIDPSASDQDRRAALAAGFDDLVNDDGNCRYLASRLLRGLRSKPELRCALPTLLDPRSAA